MLFHHATASSGGIRRPFFSVLLRFNDRVFKDLIVLSRQVQRSNVQVDASVVEHA